MSFLPFSSHQRNTESAKMLQSRMIRLRKSLTYNNSTTLHIIEKIIQLNPQNNKNLLLTLGKTLYEEYLNKVLRSTNLNTTIKEKVTVMYQDILNNLTINNQITLGIYEVPEEQTQITEEERNNQLLENPEFIFYCKMSRVGFVTNFVITNMKQKYLLVPEKKYVFDLQHETNLGYQLSFTREQYRYSDVDGLEFIGTPGTPNAYLVYTVPSYVNYYSVYIYNKLDNDRSSFVVFPYIYKFLTLNLSYKAPKNELPVEVLEKPIIECLVEKSEVRVTEKKGPKYIIEGDDFVFQGNILLDRYTIRKQYGMYYGTYRLKIMDSTNPFTIINKGKENLIQVFGNEQNKSVYTIQGLSEDPNDTSMDGSYNFYYGDVFIDVIGDFDTCALYSFKYGYNFMESLLIFSSTCTENAGVRSTYQSIEQGTIECLYPQTKYAFDMIDNVPYMTFNNNTSTYSYDENKVYGMYNGQYIFQGVPETNPIAFINKGKTDYFTYFGTSTFKKRRFGPDNQPYDFYYGTIIVRIYGDFGKMTIYDYYYGYAGGYNLLQYTDICDYSGSWISDKDSIASPSSHETEYFDNSGSYGIINVDSYMPFRFDSTTNKIYLSEDTSDNVYKYGFNIGNYVIMDIPETHAMAFLNHGIEDRIRYDGYIPYEIKATGPDGFEYSFFYGNINLYISSDFGQLSYYTLNGFYNGKKKLIYHPSSNIGYAIPNNGSFNMYPQTTNLISEGGRDFYLTINIETLNLPYSSNITSYYFQGYDRNGLIDSEEPNPPLTFFLGDVIHFGFQYSNKRFTFGIYTYEILLTNRQLITNNLNTDNETIVWTPNIPMQRYYYYRSTNNSDFMFNRINILPNENADTIPDISATIPSNGDIVSASISQIVLEVTEIVNIDSSKQYHFVDYMNNVYKSLSGNTITGSGTKTITFYTGFDIDERLLFDMSYTLIVDDGLFKNIYMNTLSSLTIVSFKTEILHDPKLLAITFESNIITMNKISVETGNYTFTNIPESHPIAILNDDISGIGYDVIDTTMIQIKVSGGQFSSPYYTFSDENDIVLDIINGGFKFMRGRTYQFIANGISELHPFRIYYNKGTQVSESLVGSSDSITIITSNDDDENSYYQCGNHSSMKGHMSFLYRTINQVEYSFYYDSILVNVSEDFGSVSYYCYYHGYMGGENRLIYSATEGQSLLQNQDNLVSVSDGKYIFNSVPYYETVTNTDISLNPSDPIRLIFNEPVMFLPSYNIQFYDTSNAFFSNYTSVESSGNDLLIYNTNMEYETFYRLIVDINSIVDLSNILYNFTDSSLNTFYFHSAFDPRPKIVSTDPVINQTDVSFDTTISITFNEPIFLGTIGNINIQNVTNNNVFDAINISEQTDISNALSGMGTNTLTITPYENLSVGTTYAILIDNTCIQDSSGNFFVGISDINGYSFVIGS